MSVGEVKRKGQAKFGFNNIDNPSKKRLNQGLSKNARGDPCLLEE
jgi:hypothetical protein